MTEYLDRYPTMHEYAEGKRINPKLTDIISRADAIDAFWEDSDIRTAEVRATIKALPSASADWIPCSERLPEEDGWYLVTVRGYETVTDVSLYSADGSAWGDVSTKQKVIAWMPLPNPYREDGE